MGQVSTPAPGPPRMPPGTPHTGLVEAIRSALAAAGDPERAVGQQRYMKSEMPYHGITTPEQRAILRPLLAEHRMDTATQWEATVRELWDGATHREQRYAALGLARHRAYRSFRTAAALPLYRHLVVTGAWWDYVDEIASHLVGEVLRAEPTVVRPVLLSWAQDDDLWLRRTAILAQLGSKADTDLDLLATAITASLEGSRHGSEFFIRKAIGWALREQAKTDPEWVRAFLARHHARLSGLSRREASKHLDPAP